MPEFGIRLKRLARRIEQFTMGPLYRGCHTYVNRTAYIHGSRKRVHLGDGVRLVNTILNVNSGDIFIGNRVIFGHGCMLLTGRHKFHGEGASRIEVGIPPSGYDIHIGADCWLASGCIVLGGVTIGDGVTVAAGAVVTSDVAPGTTVAGIPARPM